jgi:hypothetical protein
MVEISVLTDLLPARMQMRHGFPVTGLVNVGIADGFPVTGSVKHRHIAPEHITIVVAKRLNCAFGKVISSRRLSCY